MPVREIKPVNQVSVHLLMLLTGFSHDGQHVTCRLGALALYDAIVINDGSATQQATVRVLLSEGANPHMADTYSERPLVWQRKKAITRLRRSSEVPERNDG